MAEASDYLYPGARQFRLQMPYLALRRAISAIRPMPAPPPVGLAIHLPARREVFFGIPKVATRSVIAAVRADRDLAAMGLRWGEMTLADALTDSHHPAATITVIVRNPWARAYSAWSDKIARLDPAGNRARRIARFPGLRPGMPFADFVTWLASPRGGDRGADRHWLSQHCFLPRPPDTLLRLEEIGETLPLFGRRLALGQQNATGTAPDAWRAAYTPVLTDAIARRYATDIARFGYEF